MGVQLSKPALDVGIVTTNAERMMAFYRDVLGLAVLDPIVFPGAGTVNRLVVGESLLRLFVPDTAPPRTSPGESFLACTGYRYVTLNTSNLHAVVAAAKRFGTPVPREPMEIRPGVFMCQIQDPDGNWIELMQSGAAATTAPR
ncbi:MAG TPA: VOC family protein [Myxococcota bacterium]|nr:VOC family protein [Myxococcota bacterium]